jgi:hypothetical protein
MTGVVFVTVTLTSSEVQRVQQAASALWPEEINKGRLSRSEIIRRFTGAGTELLARLSDQERRALKEEFLASASTTNGFHFRGRLPRG